MTLAEVRSTLTARFRRPGLWAVFLVVFGAYAFYPALRWTGRVPRPPVSALLVEFNEALWFYLAFIWFSPLPWQWNGRPGPAPSLRAQALPAFLTSEALIIASVVLDDLLGRALGAPALPGTLYVANLCFQGPALFLVGHLQVAQEQAERQRWEAEQRRWEVERRAQEAQVRHLKGQVHPHVLFNALNGLAELMQDDPAQAETCVRAMSDFLHRVLEASRRAAWPLGEERRLVEDFLVMESMRLGDRLEVRWDWDRALDDLPVLPMLLQPLVENALKHGIGPLEEGGCLAVSARRDGETLRLEVRNTGAPPSEPAPGARRGLGLENLAARLALASGGDAAVALAREGAWTTARIQVKLTPAPSPAP